MAWTSIGSIKGPQGPAGSNATATTDASQLTSGTLNAARLPLVKDVAVALTYAASLTPNAASGNYQKCTLGGNPTLNPPSNGVDGQRLWLRFAAGASQRTITIAAGIARSTGIATTLVIPANKRGDIGLLYDSTDGSGAWTCLAASAQQ